MRFVHKNGLERFGTLGELSKIEEECVELKDAEQQNDRMFQIIEASDLLYALRSYSWQQLRVPLFILYLLALIRRPWKWIRDYRETKRQTSRE